MHTILYIFVYHNTVAVDNFLSNEYESDGKIFIRGSYASNYEVLT